MIKLRTEYIVWMRVMRDGEIVGEKNAIGTGYRYPTKREAQDIAERNEALWERIEVPA